MRQLVTLPRDQARLLADHLLTLRIKTRLDDEPGGTVIWVCDEDQVPQAREELTAFQASPTDPRYRGASSQAQAIRNQEARADADYERRQESFRDKMRELSGHVPLGPATLGLLAVCVLVAVLTSLGSKINAPVMQALLIIPTTPAEPDLPPVWDDANPENVAAQHARILDFIRHHEFWQLTAITQRGELWRLVTPIFIHFGILHLVFNMLMLVQLGSAVERRLGIGAYLGLVVLIAVTSNLAEFFVQIGLNVPGIILYQRHPLFGGMSGVLYGLFGYLWMMARASDNPERILSSQVVTALLIWLVICLLGVIGSVANTAHVVGLLVGVVVGKLVTLAKR